MNKLKYKFDKLIHNISMEYQRFMYGMSEDEIFNFDEKVADDIKKACFILACEFETHPKELTEEEWKQVLLDISFGFGSYLEMRSGFYETKNKEFKSLKKDYANGLKLFFKYHEHLWD